MPRPKMSPRQQAKARRVIEKLREEVRAARFPAHAHTLTTWAGIGQRLRDEIRTARRLGYEVHVTCTGDDGITLEAVKLEPGWERLARLDETGGANL